MTRFVVYDAQGRVCAWYEFLSLAIFDTIEHPGRYWQEEVT